MRRVAIIVICSTSRRILLKDGELRFYITAKPIRGAANQAILQMASEYFQVPISKVKIRFGHTSRRKLLEIE